jgi:hypothetical protein
VALIGVSPNVLVVRTDSPYKTVADLVAAAKAKPGKLTFASQGNGTSAHLAGELFKNLAKVQLTHIPYRGAGPAMTDLLGGQVDMMFATASAVRPFVDGGKMRALGVTTARRSPGLCQRADAGRSRRAGLCGRELVRPVRGREDAQGRDRPAQRRGQEGRQGPRLRQADRSRRPRRRRRRARATRHLRARRGSALAQGRQGQPHHQVD